MEKVKHGNAAGDSVKRYRSPETRVVFVKAQGVLCGSNDSMREYDYGNGGFGEA